MLDECADDRLGHILRQLGHDVVRSPGRSTSLPDFSVLDASSLDGRILITTDLSITDEYYLWIASGNEHPGLLLGPQKPIGDMARELTTTVARVAANPLNLRNTHRWIGS